MANTTGKKHGGRKKGTPNKTTLAVIKTLEEAGCDPILGMVEVAQKAIEAEDYSLAGSMYKELAQYVAPKRKAVEFTGQDGGPIVIGWQE